jgi:hypothetical protein
MLTTQQMIDQEGYAFYQSRHSGIRVLAKVDHDHDEVWFCPVFPDSNGKFGASEYWQLSTILHDVFDPKNHEYTVSIVADQRAFDLWFLECQQ